MAINKKQVKRLLDEHQFGDLFIDELGWQNPSYFSALHSMPSSRTSTA
jgi:hypothetical protein